MNTFIFFAVLFAVASANQQIHKISPVQSSWGLTSANRVKEWDGSLSYVSPVASSGYGSYGYYPSTNYGQAFHTGQSVHHSPGVYHSQPIQYSTGVSPKVYSGAVNYKVAPSTWSDQSYVPSTWSGYYSAGLPTAQVEKQVYAKAIASPAVRVEEVAGDFAPRAFQYSSEISHDVPAKTEEFSYNVPSAAYPARSISVGPQVATLNKVVSAPAQYSAWSGDVAVPATGSWVSDVKPTSYAWAQPKSSWRQGAWADVKPASWSSWSEPKQFNTYVSSGQPSAFYGTEYPQTIVTNAHHAVSSPWSSTWSSASPITWNEPIQKRSTLKQF